MAEMKTLNGYEVVDAKAREDIEILKVKEPDLSAYYTKTEANDNYATKTHNHSYNDLTDKPTIPSTAGLASEAYVDEAIAAIPEPEKVDLKPYALKSEIPSTEGLASEVYVTNYVNKAIAGIEFPEPECALVPIDHFTTAAELKAILDAGNTPVVNGILMYTGQGNYNLGTDSKDFYYQFSSTYLSQDYATKDEIITMYYIKFYPNRTNPWDTGHIQRLVRYQEFMALEERVAALEGGTN